MYKVYVKIDDLGQITAINSDAFLDNTADWICIDEGAGDKYHHAQGNYLTNSLLDMNGRYNYKYINGAVVEIPEAEKPEVEVIDTPTTEDRLAELEEAFKLLLEGATEIE